ALGVIGGSLEFIPVVGPLVAALVIMTVALVLSYSHWLILLIFLGTWRLIQDYVSSPRIMGDSMELHPLAAIFGVMAGGEVVGILGATGVVGQRFIQMLEHHPWFEVAWLAASDRSEGKVYAEAARWRLKTAIPAAVAKMQVSPATPDGAPKVIFAALDSAIAAELEPRFADAGCAVVSNSSALRMQEDVPLVIPEVNAGHIKLIDIQGWRKKSGGYVVTNPNCSAIGLVLALAPLDRKFGLETVMAVTMQAVSGAGYPGVASLDILGNVIPFIKNEEEKMEEET